MMIRRLDADGWYGCGRTKFGDDLGYLGSRCTNGDGGRYEAVDLECPLVWVKDCMSTCQLAKHSYVSATERL